MFTFALATFLLLFTVALCTVTLLGETRGPSHLCIFPDLWPDREMGVSLRLRSGWKCHFFFLFVYMCCIVKSNHASLIAVHWQMPYSAFKFLFFSPSSLPPSPPFPPTLPPVGIRFFLCRPTGVSYFWELNVGLHLTSRISDIFTQFFTNLYTNGFKSWHENFEQNSTRRLFMGEPPFLFFPFFFSYIFSVANFSFLICPPKFQLNGHKMSEVLLALLVQLY